MKRTMSRTLLIALAVALPFAAGCTNKQGETESPVYMTTALVSGTQSLTFDVSTGAALQLSSVTVTSHAKSTAVTDPQGFQTVELSSYRVTYTRLDGGTKVPVPETFVVGGSIPLGGVLTFTNLPVITPAASQQSPFDQLLPFNGGIDQETGLTTINFGVTVVFYGETVAGTRVSSTPTTLGVFACFGCQ